MIKKTILTLFLCGTLIISNLLITSTVFASETKVPTTLQNNNLTEINSVINKLLSSRYEVMKTWKFTSSNNIIKDPQLLDFIDKSNELDAKWYTKVNLKIDRYTPIVHINNITQTAANTYVVNATYDVEFKEHNSDIISKSIGEKKIIEIKYENNNWYVTKLVNLDEDNEANMSTNIEIKTETNTTYFNNYTNTLKSEIKNVDNMSNNIDVYYNKVKELTSGDNSTVKAQDSSYSGYNGTAAVNYAHQYAINPNPAYTYIDGDDCTNFASQVVHAGGVPFRYIPTPWAPSIGPLGATSWDSVVPFFNFMTSMGYASSPDGGCRHARLGDVLQLYNTSKQNWTHSIIVTKMTDQVYYSAHSNPKIDWPVADIFVQPSNYSNIRLLQFWH
jgi:hypothetical protein